MPHGKPQWVFTCTANLTWAWWAIPSGGGEGETANSFISLDQATEDATKHGFDPFTQYWIARIDGRTTHYRPGQPTVYLRSDEDPPI